MCFPAALGCAHPWIWGPALCLLWYLASCEPCLWHKAVTPQPEGLQAVSSVLTASAFGPKWANSGASRASLLLPKANEVTVPSGPRPVTRAQSFHALNFRLFGPNTTPSAACAPVSAESWTGTGQGLHSPGGLPRLLQRLPSGSLPQGPGSGLVGMSQPQG